MSREELVDALGSHAEPGSMRNEEIRATLEVRLSEEADRRAGSRPARAERIAVAAVAVSVVSVIVQALV